jgi:hypothetical protein
VLHAHSCVVRPGSGAIPDLGIPPTGDHPAGTEPGRSLSRSTEASPPQLGEQDQLRAACGRREPDQGVWEVRGKPQHYVSSKLMGWVALDRAVETGRDPRRQRSRGDLAGHR